MSDNQAVAKPADQEPAADQETAVAEVQETPTKQQLVEAADDDVAAAVVEAIQPHVERVYRSSETRTPLVVSERDGDPFNSIVALAKRHGCCVWTISMDSEKNEQNAIDYVDVGIQNGDWVYLTNVEKASTDVMRRLAMTLVSLSPDPKACPRREFFRLWILTASHIDVNDTIKPVLPQIMLQHAIVANAASPPGHAPASPDKMQRVVPQEPPQRLSAMEKHDQRRGDGRDSDSESDMDEPESKVTGMWFHRAVDFYSVDAGSTLSRANEVIFDVVEKQDVAAIEEMCHSGHVDVDKVKRDGMTPIMYAVSRERVQSVMALLKCNADATVVREADGAPLLYMCIESEDILMALLEAGADYHQRFEGYKLESHPSTQPHIADIVMKLKGYDKK
jgi:hypothetical protein